MLTYLHDIRNKLTLISGHTAILSKKYGEEDFLPIKTNLVRITEIINEAYRHIKEAKDEIIQLYNQHEFVKQMDLLIEAAQLLFPIEFSNEIESFNPKKEFNIKFNTSPIFQVIENAIDNSMKANATKLIIRVFETTTHCVFEMVDNGTEKNLNPNTHAQSSSGMPHGMGKEIMERNMLSVQGKVEWTRRLDYSGMIVRLYFPKQ